MSAVIKADELLLAFCAKYQETYGEDACIPNMHMHCHLGECVKDVGPIHSFWCFSFERYNGILQKMKKSWQSPESQLVHKFNNLQTLASLELPKETPIELRQCFLQMKAVKTSLPDSTIDGLMVMTYEKNMLFSIRNNILCSTRLSCHLPLPPGHEKYMEEEVKYTLHEMYATLYGDDNVIHVPLRYEEFREVNIFRKTFTSEKSRSSKSPIVLAVWASPSGILTTRSPTCDDARVGAVKYFLLHTAKIKIDSENSAIINKTHISAHIEWNQDHPRKFHFGNGIIISSSVYDTFSCASFMPVSRIITPCAVVNKNMQMDYGYV